MCAPHTSPQSETGKVTQDASNPLAVMVDWTAIGSKNRGQGEVLDIVLFGVATALATGASKIKA